jgi:hypothetical protein
MEQYIDFIKIEPCDPDGGVSSHIGTTQEGAEYLILTTSGEPDRAISGHIPTESKRCSRHGTLTPLLRMFKTQVSLRAAFHRADLFHAHSCAKRVA